MSVGVWMVRAVVAGPFGILWAATWFGRVVAPTACGVDVPTPEIVDVVDKDTTTGLLAEALADVMLLLTDILAGKAGTVITPSATRDMGRPPVPVPERTTHT
jgi:hypothetical protein